MNIFRGDLKPDLEITLTDDDVPVDLTSAESIRVIGVMENAVLFDRDPDFVTAGGVVTMLWQVDDTQKTGNVRVEVEVTWPGVKPQTFRPPEVVHILADLG